MQKYYEVCILVQVRPKPFLILVAVPTFIDVVAAIHPLLIHATQFELTMIPAALALQTKLWS